MKAILFHGTGDKPDSYWLPYIDEQLKLRGYNTYAPALPNSETARIDEWLSFALKTFNYDENTILIGHSAGATLILSILENIDTQIKQAILVAGFYKPLNDDPPHPILQSYYDWEKIKSNCKEFVFVNSDNDPWGCDDKMGKELVEKLGGTLIVPKGEGHMGSNTFNQPYKEFPLLLELIT